MPPTSRVGVGKMAPVGGNSVVSETGAGRHGAPAVVRLPLDARCAVAQGWVGTSDGATAAAQAGKGHLQDSWGEGQIWKAQDNGGRMDVLTAKRKAQGRLQNDSGLRGWRGRSCIRQAGGSRPGLSASLGPGGHATVSSLRLTGEAGTGKAHLGAAVLEVVLKQGLCMSYLKGERRDEGLGPSPTELSRQGGGARGAREQAQEAQMVPSPSSLGLLLCFVLCCDPRDSRCSPTGHTRLPVSLLHLPVHCSSPTASILCQSDNEQPFTKHQCSWTSRMAWQTGSNNRGHHCENSSAMDVTGR